MKPKDMSEIDIIAGQRINEIRVQKGLSLEQLADHIGVSHQQTQKYEKGKDRITLGRACLIANTLGVTLNDLVEQTAIENTATSQLALEAMRQFTKLTDAEQRVLVNLMRIMGGGGENDKR